MTAGENRTAMPRETRRLRRRALPVLAATGAWAVCLMGAAPAAVAEDVQSKQWYLDAMQAEQMWKVSTGKGIKVAVVDSGVNPSTSSLRGQVLAGKDLSGAAGDAYDDYGGHGTTMAELIAGTGKGGGLKGLAPGAKIVPIRTAFTTLKNGSDEDTTAAAVRAAADSDAQIINMSLGGDLRYPQLDKAIKYAASKGKLMFAATGNDGDGKSRAEYPAAYPEVVGVGSVDSTGTVSKFSTHGNTVSVAAPGSDVPKWCDKTLKSYCDGEGTSAATAIASASAALIWSKHRDWNANQVARVLVGTTDGVMEKRSPSKYVGYGAVRPRLNLLDGKGEPGNPKQPAFLDNGDFDTSKAAFKESAAEPGKGEGADSGKADAGSQTDPAKAGSGDNSTLWTSLGIAAAVIVLGGGAFAFLRARRG